MPLPLVLGVGNYLLGDEGAGVHAVWKLEEAGGPAGVTALDGGTGGFHLLSLFQEHNPNILIDATMDAAAAGTVRLLQPKFASDFPRTLSAHDIGLRDLLESAALLGPLPGLYLITVSIEKIQSLTVDLNPSIRAAIPEVLRNVLETLATSSS